MHAGEVDAGDEDVGVARQRLRGEQSAVRETPDADARSDRRRRASADTSRRRRRPGTRSCRVPSVFGALLERPAVADAAAVVDRHHDVALRREPLVVARTPSGRTACSGTPAASARDGPPCTKTIAGRFSPGLRSFGRKSWLWISKPSAALREDDLRRHVRGLREILHQRREDDLRRCRRRRARCRSTPAALALK